jgi:MinD-like ATPase involved in chromosome partitioning or flagellar assembly
MILAIWGRDGTGKSTLADALGRLSAQKDVTAIIDTDLTQPTLPVRVNGKKLNADASLGKAISGMGADDAAKYLHQHPQNKRLFYAGLTVHDEYLSYEPGLDASDVARDFVERCAALAHTVILDLSGQRTDPFVPAALSGADKIIIPITPDVRGVCWYNAVKPFLRAMNTSERILPIVTMVTQPALDVIEKAANIRFVMALPYVREFRQNGAEDASTPAAARYSKQVWKLYKTLTEVET